jgi:DNA-binding NarL/FixJ family response regulator
VTDDISVLLVDDQPLFREGVRVIVDAQEGMRVVASAGDGREAVRLVDELSPDVVLDDRAATAIRHGASGFLLKDTTPVMLRDAIRTVHAGNAVLAPRDLTVLLEHQFRAPAPPPPALATLTDKEREVFDAVARGMSNSEIAGVVFASESTVKTHVGAVLRKLALRDRVQVVVFAHRHRLLAEQGG